MAPAKLGKLLLVRQPPVAQGLSVSANRCRPPCRTSMRSRKPSRRSARNIESRVASRPGSRACPARPGDFPACRVTHTVLRSHRPIDWCDQCDLPRRARMDRSRPLRLAGLLPAVIASTRCVPACCATESSRAVVVICTWSGSSEQRSVSCAACSRRGTGREARIHHRLEAKTQGHLFDRSDIMPACRHGLSQCHRDDPGAVQSNTEGHPPKMDGYGD